MMNDFAQEKVWANCVWNFEKKRKEKLKKNSFDFPSLIDTKNTKRFRIICRCMGIVRSTGWYVQRISACESQWMYFSVEFVRLGCSSEKYFSLFIFGLLFGEFVSPKILFQLFVVRLSVCVGSRCGCIDMILISMPFSTDFRHRKRRTLPDHWYRISQSADDQPSHYCGFDIESSLQIPRSATCRREATIFAAHFQFIFERSRRCERFPRNSQ